MSGSHGHNEPLPEPSTPMWLPALGAVLFLTAAIAWTMSPSAPSGGSEAAIAAVAAVPAQPAPSASAVARPMKMPRQTIPH